MKTSPIPLDEFELKNDSRSLKDLDYMEFYIGDFESSPTYWNQDSRYLNHKIYKIIHQVFRDVREDFNDFNVNKFDIGDQEKLLTLLAAYQKKITNVNLERKFGHPDNILKERLSEIISQLSTMLNFSKTENKPFWILGM